MSRSSHRLEAPLVGLVRLCAARPWWAILVTVAFSLLMATYAAKTLTMDTDTNALFPRDIPFLANEDHFDKLFPDEADQILVVIDAKSLADAEHGADKLANRLRQNRKLFPAVQQPNGGPFFRRNGLLYLSRDELTRLSDMLSQAQPFLGSLSTQPGLTGVLDVIQLIFQGANQGAMDDAAVRPFLKQVNGALDRGLAGGSARIDWGALFAGQPGLDRAPQAMVLVRPTLDNTGLMPGKVATDFIRQSAQDLGLTAKNGYRVRLTGSVVLSDEEFATVQNGAELAGIVAGSLVVILLVIALRSVTLILAALFTLIMGLLTTMGWAALAVGELNLISIAFAVMFIGIGIDFGIQFCMRLREERYRLSQPLPALEATARGLVWPLLIAAIATSVGFFAFLPTNYSGVAALGVIAGGGILVAFLFTLTLLPAILSVATPRSEAAPVGYQRLAPFNAWLIRRRGLVLSVVGVATLVAALGIARLHFDFDPLHLKNPNSEGMSTLHDLMKDPMNTPYTLDAIADSPAKARAKADRLSDLSQVRMTVTALDLVPEHQDEKLGILQNLSFLLGPALTCDANKSAPSPSEIEASGRKAETSIKTYLASPTAKSPLKQIGEKLAGTIDRLQAKAGSARLKQMSDDVIAGFSGECSLLVEALDAKPVTLNDLPPDFKRSWITRDGQYRIQIYPNFAKPTQKNLIDFVRAVRRVAPEASGPPISIYESSRLIINAFATAAALAVVAITVLLFIALRRLADVGRVLLPLALASVWTLGGIGLVGLPLNFANIIGLPLLLGIGVTFPIYLVHAWRTGEDRLLAAPVARAVLFSALTTLASFGSLAISTHPGTSSLGVLLSIALGLTLVSTFIFLPALLGEPPVSRNSPASSSES